MKQLAASLLLFLLLLISPALAERVPAKAWRRVQTYDMQELQKLEPLPLRRIIGVRFNYRHRDIRHLKPNWYQGSIWRAQKQAGRYDFDHIAVMVSKADLPAFESIPTDPQSQQSAVVYGEVLKDADANYIFLRLLGTKVKRDARGNAVVKW